MEAESFADVPVDADELTTLSKTMDGKVVPAAIGVDPVYVHVSVIADGLVDCAQGQSVLALDGVTLLNTGGKLSVTTGVSASFQPGETTDGASV